MDDKVLSVCHLIRSLASAVAATALPLLAFASSAAGATDIWMFAGPRVTNVAPGWEGLRTDSGDMWKPDAPWDTVAHSVKVIQFAPTNVDRARDSDLQQALADIKRRNIALAVGDGLLIRSDRCRSKTEAYGEPGAVYRKLKLGRSGGEVRQGWRAI